MKKKFLSYLLALAMTLSLAPVSVFAEGETTEDTGTTEEVSTTVVATINPDNYASIYLQKGSAKTEAGGYNGTTRKLLMYYNTLFSDNTHIYMHSGSILSEYTVPLKAAVAEMDITHYVSTFPSNAKNNGSHPIFYNIGAFSTGLNIANGDYNGPTTYGGTDGDAEYYAVKAITENYWPISSGTSVGHSSTNWTSQVAASFKGSSETTGSRTKDVAAAAVTAFKADTTTDVITFATGRSTSGYAQGAYSLYAEDRIPYLTATYEKAALLEIINATAEADMPALIDELGTIGALADSTVGYAGYTALSERLQKYASELISDAKGAGFADYAAFITAYDAAVTAASNVSAGDPIVTEVSPVNYAAIHIFDGGYHGYARPEEVYYNTPYTENVKLYAESGSIITSYEVPLKDSIDGMAINYSINTAGQMSNGHVPVFYDINKFEIDAPAGKYAMVTETATEEPTEEPTDTPVDGEEEEEEGSDGAVDIPEEETNVDVYGITKTYTDNYFPSSSGSYGYSGKAFAGQLAYKITSSSTGRIAHDVTSTALAAYVADTDADYITFATGRETSGYINFSVNASTASAIPTLTLTYNATDIVDYINSAASADALEEILTNLGKTGILDEGTYGYAGYTGLGGKYKQTIREAIYEEIAEGGYLRFADFMNVYDSAVLYATNSIIDNPDVHINFNDETANDVSGNGKNATIVGASFTEGPDGSKALKVENTFGKTAQQYLNMGAYDFSSDSFSIVFWMKAPEKGTGYDDVDDRINAGTAVDFSTYTGTKGGVVLSNKDFSVNDKTGFGFAAMARYTDFSYNMKMGDANAVNTVGVQTAVDSRWHQISYVVNRAGNATVYVDGTAIKSTDVSSLTGSLGNGDLVFGADGLGQYGMLYGEFDDIKIYSSALEATKIEEMYYITALKKVNDEIEDFLVTDKAALYSDANVTALESELADSKAFADSYEFGNLDSIKAQYEAIDTFYNEFLIKDIDGMIAFGSDVHISEKDENHLSAQNLKRFLTEGQSWETAPKSFILTGDIADVGADDLGYFFSHLEKWVVDGSNMVICRGNHDEPKGNNNATGETLDRTALKNLFVTNMTKYVDTDNALNASVVADGTLSLPYYYSTDGIAHYITIDAYWPDVRKISDTQFEWLESVLNKISGDGKPIFIAIHTPLRDTTGGSSYLGLDEADDAQLKALLSKHDNVFVLNGHSHHGLGGGSGNPVKVNDSFWQVNAPILASKTINSGYEWASGYYITVQDGYVTFRARDFENQKWLRDYDLTFALEPAKAKLPDPVEAVCTEDFADTEAIDAETGASIWEGTITGTGTAFSTVKATVTNKEDKTAEGKTGVSTISTTGEVSVVVVVNLMESLIDKVMISVE